MARKIKVGILHEQIILGSMLANQKVRKRLIVQLRASDFIAPRHRAIFAAIQELEQRGLDYIPITLKSFLPPDNDWGGLEYLKELESLTGDENVDFHLERSRWDNARATIINDHLNEFEVALKDPRLEIDDGLRMVHRMEELLQGARGRTSIIAGTALAARYMANLYARESGIHIRSSGYLSLDGKLTEPFGRGKITIVSATPSIGKTTFCLNMAQKQARKWKVGYLAWESGTVSAMDIVCASALGIPLTKLVKRPSSLTKEEWDKINELLDTMFGTENNFTFLEPPPREMFKEAGGPWEINERVLDWFESQLFQWDCDIIYWDLFTKKLPDRRPDAISWALDRIQDMGDRTGKHFCLLHQLTLKEIEKRKDKRPNRGDLKGTGGWVETPDTVFALHRRAVYEPGIEDNELEVYCLKQRIGPWPWRMIMDWDGEKCLVSGGRIAQITVTENENEI